MFAIPPGLLGHQLNISNVGLISRWKFDEASGTTAADSVGVNNGTYTGGVTLGVAGLLRYDTHTAASFNGTSGFVNLGSPAALNLSTDFTIEAWIKPSGTTTYRGIISYALGGYYLRVNDTSNIVSVLKSGISLIGDGITTLVAGNIYHVVYTRDATATGHLYLNGSLEVATFGSVFSGTGGLRIGADAIAGPTPAEFFAGVIGEISIFGREMLAAEVADRYAAQS